MNLAVGSWDSSSFDFDLEPSRFDEPMVDSRPRIFSNRSRELKVKFVDDAWDQLAYLKRRDMSPNASPRSNAELYYVSYGSMPS